LGFALLNTAVRTDPNSTTASPLYDVTGPGAALNEDIAVQYSFAVGLDTFQNSFTEFTQPGGGLNDASDNEIKVGFNGVFNPTGVATNQPTGYQAACTYKFDFDLGSANGGTYRLHRDNIDDDADFDHFHMVLDLLGQTCTITITPAPSRNLPPFSPINNFAMPCLSPYPMRAAFGARTGGATDNHDIANVNIVFTP
jgi:hypothetical protein